MNSVFISSGSQQVEGGWVDAKRMFLGAVDAGPVYELLGRKDLGTRQFPALETALISGEIAFRRHSGGHTTGPNWPTFLKFADRYFSVPTIQDAQKPCRGRHCDRQIDSAIMPAEKAIPGKKSNAQPDSCAVGRRAVTELRENDADAFTLVHGADRCEIFPHVGGSIGGWTVQGQQMFRPASTASIAARDPFGMASFPLVPYSNRIGAGRFEWQGDIITLARNFPPEPHAIHGVGFQRTWQVQASSPDSAVLTLNHQPDAGWPWAFEASQRITIGERILTLHMSAINLAPQPAPLAFGHHPYFLQRGASLAFRAQAVWLAGDDGLPSERVEPFGKLDFRRATPVGAADVDNCFTGWSGPAHIAWRELPLALEIKHSRELQSAVVYIRSGAEGFCFEPVPHINNALNLRGHEPAMPIIAPGATYSASIRFRAVTQ